MFDCLEAWGRRMPASLGRAIAPHRAVLPNRLRPTLGCAVGGEIRGPPPLPGVNGQLADDD